MGALDSLLFGGNFGTGSPAEEAQKVSLADLLTGLGKALTPAASPEAAPNTLFQTKNGVTITDQDIDKAMGVAMASSGGGLSVKGIKAYHGSPHDFDRFDLSKIGTGEGAQAYGHGLYFAENPTTARAYRDALELRNKGPGRPSYETPEYSARSILDAVDGDPQRAIAEIEKRRESVRGLDPRFRAAGSEEKFQAVLDILKERKPLGGGKMYEVNINADPAHFLDWDKPLSGQGARPREALDKIWGLPSKEAQSTMSAEDAYRAMGITFHQPGRGHLDSAAVSNALNEAGIPGIKYLDQGSRGAGQGSSNYVVFNDQLIDILRKYGLALPGAAGAAMAAQSNPDGT